MRDFISIDGPWPQMQDNAEVVDALARALYEGTSLCKEIAPDPPIQIHHFSCHSNTSSEHYDDYTLRLSTRRGARREISFAQLRTAHLDQLSSDAGRRSPRSRAVIILNSCASSRTDPLTAVSFPLWFLKCGHRAFIGTEADVPDMVSARFAESLYGRILEYRRPLGEALVWARRDLLRDFRNPLGLLYAAYGNSDLMIEAARPGSYRAARRSNVA